MNATVEPLFKVRAEALAHFAAAGLCGNPAKDPPPPSQPVMGCLSRHHYAGDFDRREADAADGAQATYDGTITATLLDRDLIGAMLPPQLRLATTVDPVRWQHPVICMFGRQDEPRELRRNEIFEIPTAQPYDELILLIPYVVRVGVGVNHQRWHSYSARMYLDYFPAIAIGNLRYAYSKELGEFEKFGFTTEARSAGNTVFEIDIGAGAGANGLDAAQARVQWPAFADLQHILEMPIVGHNNALKYVRSYFEWDYTDASIASTQSAFRFRQAFRLGMQPWVDLDLLAGASDATFSVRKVRWRLSTKFLSKRF